MNENDKCHKCNQKVRFIGEMQKGDSYWLVSEDVFYHDKCWFKGAEVNHRVNEKGKRTWIQRTTQTSDTGGSNGTYTYNWNTNEWTTETDISKLGNPPNDNDGKRERERESKIKSTRVYYRRVHCPYSSLYFSRLVYLTKD